MKLFDLLVNGSLVDLYLVAALILALARFHKQLNWGHRARQALASASTWNLAMRAPDE